MNSGNSQISEPQKLLLNLSDKINLNRKEKYVALSNFSIYYTWKNRKGSYENNKFKISAPTWKDKFELLDGSYSVSDIQDYFEYILKKHREKTHDASTRIYVNKIGNRITFKIKTRFYLKILTPETKSKISEDENGENVPHLEITEVILKLCNIANNDYQQDLRVLYTFVANKSFGIWSIKNFWFRILICWSMVYWSKF